MNNDGTLHGSFTLTSPDLLHFNGIDTYCTIPLNVQTATSWKVTIDFLTTSTKSGNQIYNQPCIFGYDSANYRSRDFHIDMSSGYLYIFSGLSGTNSSSQLNYGTLTTNNGDFGWNTQQYIADGNIHTVIVEASYVTNRVTVTLDNVNLGYLNIVDTINSTYLSLGSSYAGEKVYAEFDLKSFSMEINEYLLVEYKNFTTSEITSGVITDSAIDTSSNKLHFNGINTYCSIPVNVQSATSWKATIELSTTSTVIGIEGETSIYYHPAIFGYDSNGFRSKDFHIDINNGYLYVFSGLGGTNNSSQLNYGTLSSFRNDFGWNTQQYVADGNHHTVVVEASYTTNTITLTLDGVNLGYLNVAYPINSTYLVLGCSYPYAAVYAEFDMYNFAMEINGTLAVEYQQFTLGELIARVLTDSSGNNNNGTLYGNFALTDNTSFTPILFVTDVSSKIAVTPSLFVTTVPFTANVTINCDTQRSIINEVSIRADTLREIVDGTIVINLQADTARALANYVTINADTKREIKTYSYLYFSTSRLVSNQNKQQKNIGKNILTLKPVTMIDNAIDFDSIVNFDFNGGINTTGEYNVPSNHIINNTNNNFAYVNVDIDAEPYNINQWIDYTRNFDTIKNFDGENLGKNVKVTPYMRTSDNGVTYGDWKVLISGTQYQAKYYDFKLRLSTSDENTTVIVRKFGFTVYE